MPIILEKNYFYLLFTEDTSVLRRNNDDNIQLNISSVFKQLNRWFTSNVLSFNYNKTKFIHIRTINVHSRDISLEYNNKCVTMDFNTDLLGIILDNTWHWGEKNTDALIIKLRAVC
jgi:hypothetical protein